jgi:hypothetical protein
MRGIHLNQRVDKSRSESVLHRITNDPSRTIGNFVYWLAITITTLVAISYLQIPVINDFIVKIYNYIPSIIGSIFILGIALIISGSLAALVSRWMGETITGKVVATAIPTVILSVAGFAVLEQLKVAPVIISTTYIAIIGSLALASAIAFGLGGRQVAARLLEAAYEQGARNIENVRRDLARGTSKAKSDAMLYARELPRKKKSSYRDNENKND